MVGAGDKWIWQRLKQVPDVILYADSNFANRRAAAERRRVSFTSALNKQFWKGRRVLLTGHTGFKGSWLTLWIQSLGARTVGYSLPPPTEPSLYELADVSKGITS